MSKLMFLQSEDSRWLTTSFAYCFLTNDASNRLQMYDGGVFLTAPGWQWGNLPNNYELADWGGSAYFRDAGFNRHGVRYTFEEDGRISQTGTKKFLCLKKGSWVYWSSQDEEPGVIYLHFTKISINSEEAEMLAAAHPSAHAPIEHHPA